MHVSETFQILQQDECNIFSNFALQEYKLIRKRIINCILATDMTNHMNHLTALRAKLDLFNIKNGENLDKLMDKTDNVKKFDNQQVILNWMVHACDVSNPAKPISVYDEWVDRIRVEFFNQGDEERNAGLPISYLCDRNTVDMVNSQLGFIKFVVQPTFDLLLNIAPEIQPYKNRIIANLAIYEERDKHNKANKLP
jgi:hypothetical protein